MNINYRIPDLEGFYNTNAFVDEATLDIKCPLPDAEIRYTTDGKFPTKASQLYEGKPQSLHCAHSVLMVRLVIW